jgi:hypothetical protein
MWGTDMTRVLEAVLWILNTGAQWHMLLPNMAAYDNSSVIARRYRDIVAAVAAAFLSSLCEAEDQIGALPYPHNVQRIDGTHGPRC